MSAAIPVALLIAGLLVGAFIVENASILGKASTDTATITSTVTQTVTSSNSTSTTLLTTCGLGSAFQCSSQSLETTTTPFLTVGGGAVVSDSFQMQSFNFNVSPGSCACSGDVLVVYLLNSGNSSSAIGAVYFDGVLETVTTPPTTDTALTSNQVYLLPAGTAITSGANGEIEFGSASSQTTYGAGLTGQVVISFAIGSPLISGTSHTLKIVSTTGGTSVVTVVAGRSG